MSKRILIIDDEEHIRHMIRLTLEAAGYEVGEAGDGVEGVRLYGDGSRWDAVLLDQRMQGMDGLEALRHIKERQIGARVIMVTAYASIELAVDAMKLGATDFVRKPMTPEIVRNAVEAALLKATPTADTTDRPSGDNGEEHLRPLMEYVTMNGFSFVPVSDVKGVREHRPDERRFIVKNPKGLEQEVVVKIDPEAVGYVERMTRRRLPPESSFWTSQATRLLSTYLWNEGKVPSTGQSLILKDIDRDDLPIAERWEDKASTPQIA